MPAAVERQYVLDLPVDPLPKAQAVALIEGAIAANRAGQGRLMQIVTLNAEMTMQAQADPELATIIRNCGLVVPDGSGVIWALSRQGIKAQKVAGVELVDAMAELAGRAGQRIYFLGAQPGVAAEAAKTLSERYPGLIVAGVRDGFFKPEDEAALFDEIRAAAPDMLFAALGVPRQEKWIAAHQAELGVPVAMGVGGSFDVFAGRVQRAPHIFQALHLEWLFRLIQEPWRFQRIKSTLPRFIGEVFRRG